DEAADDPREKAQCGVNDYQNDRNQVEEVHSRNLARCRFSSPSRISAITLSTSASVRVRSGLRKVKANATLLCPSGTWAPRYSSNASACASSGPPASLMADSSDAAATVSSTTT